MTYRELFRLSYISLFLLISTLPVQSADKVLFGAKAVWNITLNLLGVGALRHVEGARRTQPLIKEDNYITAVVTQPVSFPVSPQPADVAPVYEQEGAPSSSSFAQGATADRRTVSVNTDASSICNAAKALNDHFVDNRAEEEWQALRDQQALRQLNLSSRKGVAGSPEFWDRVDHPEKYDFNGRLITDHVYGFPNPNVKSSSPVLLTNAPVITKEIHKQATTVTATALVMMTRLAPVASSQVPLIASISTEATKTRAVGDMLEMMNNPAPEVNPAMIAFLKDDTMPVAQAATPGVVGGAMAVGGTAIAGKAFGAGAFATAAKGIAITAAAIGVAPGTLLIGGTIVAAGTVGYIYGSYTNKKEPLQIQKTVQNDPPSLKELRRTENSRSKRDDDGGPKKPKKDYSETITDLAEKTKKAKELADKVREDAKNRGWTENNSMPKENDAITMGHIFNKNDGHDLYSKESYDELNRLVKDAKNFVGRDKYGKEWFSEILENGKERWAYSIGGKVKSGGTNRVPSAFCPEEGLIKVPVIKPPKINIPKPPIDI